MEDELDRMLSRQDEIVPSSGFVSSVMDAVRREAAVPDPGPFPPLAFPWVRALPMFLALAAVIAMLISGFVELIHMPASAVQRPLLAPAVEHALAQVNAGWLAVALLLAFLSTFFSVRFAVGQR
ncbi:MAG TPA: hypothetical protein VEV40_11885 [Alloacidobacterium sp.]|nr:hypothetical protein [Alloacidobacterium sp.]